MHIKEAVKIGERGKKCIKMYSIGYREAALEIVSKKGIRGTSRLISASSSSICRWNKDINHKKHQKESSLLTDTILAAVTVCMTDHPEWLALNVQAFVNNSFQLNVSRQLIQLAIKRIDFTYKSIQTRGRKANSCPEYSSRINRFAKAFLDIIKKKQLVVAIDESGFDERSRPKKGYAPRGKQAILYQPPVHKVKIKRQSLLMAIGSDGSNNYELHEKSVKNDSFADFILQLPYPKGTTLIMDNLSVHDTENVKVSLLVQGYHALFTPPHTPDCNPIEMVFGVMKRKFDVIRFLPNFTTIKEAIERIIPTVTSNNDLIGYFRHVQDYLTKLTLIDDNECLQTVNSHPTMRWDGRQPMKAI